MVKNPSVMQELQETGVCFLGGEDSLEEGMATHLSSCLENPMDTGAWRATVSRTAKSWTRLRRLSIHTCIHQPAHPHPYSYSLPAPSLSTTLPSPPACPTTIASGKTLWSQTGCGESSGDCWLLDDYHCLAFHFEPALCKKEKCILTVVCITIKRIFSPVHLSFFNLTTVLR